jgi:hypothetical protein
MTPTLPTLMPLQARVAALLKENPRAGQRFCRLLVAPFIHPMGDGCKGEHTLGACRLIDELGLLLLAALRGWQTHNLLCLLHLHMAPLTSVETAAFWVQYLCSISHFVLFHAHRGPPSAGTPGRYSAAGVCNDELPAGPSPCQ